MAKRKAAVKSEKPKVAKLKVGKKVLRDLAPRETSSGQVKGGRLRRPEN